MKNPIKIAIIVLASVVLMSFYVDQGSNKKYEYLSIYANLSPQEPVVAIYQANKPSVGISIQKKDNWDFSKLLAQVQDYEDQGWELMEVIDQSTGYSKVAFIMRKPR